MTFSSLSLYSAVAVLSIKRQHCIITAKSLNIKGYISVPCSSSLFFSPLRLCLFTLSFPFPLFLLLSLSLIHMSILFVSLGFLPLVCLFFFLTLSISLFLLPLLLLSFFLLFSITVSSFFFISYLASLTPSLFSLYIHLSLFFPFLFIFLLFPRLTFSHPPFFLFRLHSLSPKFYYTSRLELTQLTSLLFFFFIYFTLKIWY